MYKKIETLTNSIIGSPTVGIVGETPVAGDGSSSANLLLESLINELKREMQALKRSLEDGKRRAKYKTIMEQCANQTIVRMVL